MTDQTEGPEGSAGGGEGDDAAASPPDLGDLEREIERQLEALEEEEAAEDEPEVEDDRLHALEEEIDRQLGALALGDDEDDDEPEPEVAEESDEVDAAELVAAAEHAVETARGADDSSTEDEIPAGGDATGMPDASESDGLDHERSDGEDPDVLDGEGRDLDDGHDGRAADDDVDDTDVVEGLEVDEDDDDIDLRIELGFAFSTADVVDDGADDVDRAEDDDAAAAHREELLDSLPPGAPVRRRRGLGLFVGIGVLAVAIVGIVLASQDDDELTGGATTTTLAIVDVGPTTTLPDGEAPADSTLEYFRAYATQTVSELGRLLGLSAQGSPAYAYGVHQEALARIDPEPNAPFELTVDGDEIRLCPTEDDGGDCIGYGDFQANEAGLLTDFSIDGTPLSDRIAVGKGTVVTAGPMAISIVSAYRSAADLLFVVYAVRNDGSEPITADDVYYLRPNGDRVDPQIDTFAAPLEPGQFRLTAAAFPTTERGGTLGVASTTSEGVQVAQITVP